MELGSVLIWIMVLVCLVALFAVNEISANPYDPTRGSNVHAAIAGPPLLLKGILVPDFTVKIYRAGTVAQPFNFLLGQGLRHPQSLHFWDGWTQNIPVRMFWARHWRQLRCKRVFVYVHRSPMYKFVCWRLPGVLNGDLPCRTSLRIDDSRNRFRVVSTIVYRIRNVGNYPSLNGHISPQLALRTPAHREYRKQRQNAAYDTQSSQNPIGEVCRGDSSFQILFGMRLVISVSLCILSIFLAYFGYTRRWCVWLGLIGMGLGLLLLLAPIHWEWFLCAGNDDQGHTEYRQPFQHNSTIVPQKYLVGGDADYGQIIKTYGHESTEGQRRYSQPEFVSAEKKVVCGRPDLDLISTSYIERLNATTRLHMRRLTRLTLAFSKKRENFTAAVGLHFAYYNFVKRHNTLRCTPAMAAGVEKTFWSVGDLLEAAA